jgi:hypothetical protein
MTMTTTPPKTVPLFRLGQTVATQGAVAACTPDYLRQCLKRHVCGDWGHVCAEDAATNDEALELGNRILSAYPIDPAKPCKGWGKTASGSLPNTTAASPPSCCQASTKP